MRDFSVNVWFMIIIGWLVMSAMMSGLWVFQRRKGDAAIVDVAWGMGVGLLAVFFACGSVEGDLMRRILIATLEMMWAVRLSGYVLWRVVTMPEDGRYRALKKDWGKTAQKKMFRFYHLQACGSLLFALPMLIAAQGPAPMGLMDLVGIFVWIVAFVGEVVADRQLARFRSDPKNLGRVCRQGLWKYSRHPNYFFEWLHWWTYVCLAISAPFGWLTVLGPILMLYFILRVTGIPPTEAQALRSRGDAYREYQRTTSAFFPWPPRFERAIAC